MLSVSLQDGPPGACRRSCRARSGKQGATGEGQTLRNNTTPLTSALLPVNPGGRGGSLLVGRDGNRAGVIKLLQKHYIPVSQHL
jgi:hypothetical protein